MLKSGKLLFGAVMALAAVAIVLLIGTPGQAAPGKKPVPEPVWGMQIPESLNLAGMPGDFVYKSGNPCVRITVQKSTTGGIVTRTTVHFYIYPSTTPPQVWAKFQNVNLETIDLAADPGPAGACGFPFPYNQGISPSCFFAFVNTMHPLPGYEHLLFYFWIDADIEDAIRFPLGEEVQWFTGGAFTINIWNDFEPISQDDPEPYQTIVARLAGGDNTCPQGFFITRTGANTWEFRIEQKMFAFSQSYHWAETGTGRNGKPTTVVTGWRPLEGEGPLSLKLRLIKNPI
jgi:hypothetical protein